MTEKPAAPKPEDDTYSDEEIAKRMDAIVRAMIGMKPKPRRKADSIGPQQPSERKRRIKKLSDSA